MPSQESRNTLDRAFHTCQESLCTWMEDEVKRETPALEVMKAVIGLLAYVVGDLIRLNFMDHPTRNLVGVAGLWFTDSLRIALGTRIPDERDFTLRKGNGNGAPS